MLRLGFDRSRRYAPPLGAPESRGGGREPEVAPGGPPAGRPAARDDTVDGGPFDPQRSFLLASFRTFFAEVARVRQMVLRDPGALLPAEPTGYTPEHGSSQLARAVRRNLQHSLEQLALEAGARAGEYGASLFVEAQYVMAAAADEVFLTMDWPGREAWLGNLLEGSLFGTQIAGEEVFRRLDRMLANRTGVSAELASVYFMALALGFEGQYRDRGDATLLAYRQRLYRFIFRRDVSRATGVFVAQPYEHIAQPARPTRLPLVQRWALVLALTCATYVFASHTIWRSVTADLRAIHADIRAVLADTVQTPQ